MKKLIAYILPVVISFPAFAGVAPTAQNSALTQSGAKIAPPAKQSAENKEDKREQRENAPKDSAR